MPVNWNIPIPPRNKPKYTDVVLAYIDVLGFSAAVCASKEKPQKTAWKTMFEIFEIITTDRSTEDRTQVLHARLMSDSIIIWGEAHKISLGFLIQLASRIEEVAIKHGFLVRGAIVSGKHYIERSIILNPLSGTSYSQDEILISPALAHAVSIENKLKNPGIVLDRTVRKYVKILRKKPKIVPFSVHPFSGDALHLVEADQKNIPSRLSNKDVKRAIKDLIKFKKIIESGLRQTRKVPHHYRKWKYIAKRFNHVAKNVGQRISYDFELIKF